MHLEVKHMEYYYVYVKRFPKYYVFNELDMDSTLHTMYARHDNTSYN